MNTTAKGRFACWIVPASPTRTGLFCARSSWGVTAWPLALVVMREPPPVLRW